MLASSVLLLAVLLGMHAQSSAQVSFVSTEFEIEGQLNVSSGVALDTSGNIYASQLYTNNILKIDALTHVAAPYLTNAAGSSFNQPESIWIDFRGNLYFVDLGNARIVMWSLPLNSLVATYPIQTTGTSAVVTTDSLGNIWWGSGGNVSQIPANSPSGTASTPVITSGIGYVLAMAFDSARTLYVSDAESDSVFEYTLQFSYATQFTPVAGANHPVGLYIDTGNNLYVAEANLNSVIKYLYPGYGMSVPISQDIISPAGITADKSGNLFVTSLGTGAVIEVSSGIAALGQVDVGAQSSAVNVNFEVAAGTTVSSIQVLDQGAPAQEFNVLYPDYNPNLCPTGTYPIDKACSVDVSFTPAYPGQRLGAVQLITSDGTATTAPLSGFGSGPLAAFSPTSQTALVDGLNQPFGIAFDGSGNLFEADYGTNQIEKFNAATGYSNSISIGASGPVAGLAIDGAGNIFFSVYNKAQVLEALAASGYHTIIAVGSNTKFSHPFGLALDGSGNLFVADRTLSKVFEIPYKAGKYGIPVSIGSGFSNPYSVALDPTGNVYVADAGHSAVKEILKAGNYGVVRTLVSVSGIQFVASDANGNIYMARRGVGSNSVCEIEAVNGSIPDAPPIITLAYDPDGPEVVALDGSGNLYYGTSGGANIVELNYANPPSLNFGSTMVGLTSTDSPQTLTISNNGNAALSFSIPNSGNNPSISTNFTLDSSSGGACQLTGSGSSEPSMLAAGGSCTLPVTFAPTAAGSMVGTLVLTDNNLNAPNATQSIVLTGVGTAESDAITFNVASQSYGGAPFTLAASSASSGAFTYAVISGPATVSGSTATVTGIGTVVLSVTQAASGDYAAGSQNATFTVAQGDTEIASLPAASAITYGQTLASSLLTGGLASTAGSFAFTAPSTVPSPGYTLQPVVFTPTDTTDYPSVTVTVSVIVNQAAAAIAISNTTQSYNGMPEPITVISTPAGLGTSVSYTGVDAATYGPSATAPTNPGMYSVVVTVVDPDYAGQQSGTLTINQLDPTVSLGLLQGQPAATSFGTTAYFVLSSATMPQCPTGTAQLYVDGNTSGSPVALTSTMCSQQVQFQIATLNTGQHSIYVAYSGDTFFVPESSSTLSYTVTQDTTTVTLAASGTSLDVDQPLTFTATVTPALPNNGQPPSGAVIFSDGISPIGTGSTLTGTAPYTSTFTTSSLAAGSHNVSATFVDTDGNCTGSSSGIDIETVNLIVPTIDWTPAPTEFPYGTPLGSGQFNATAVDSNNNPIDGRFVYNFDSGTVLPTGAANLTATFTPADPTTYATNSASVTITVDPVAAVTLSTTSLTFASTQQGATSTLPVTITNSGDANLTVSAISITGTNVTDFASTDNCVGSPVVPGSYCTVQVTFAPLAAGTLTATLNIGDNADGSPQSISLSGTGFNAPAVSLSSNSLLFPSQAAGSSSVSQSVILTNTGSATLTISSIAVTGPNASSFVFANTCGSTLAVAANCTIHGHFAPTTGGALTASIQISDNAGASQQSISLSGAGLNAPAVSLSSASLSFPSQIAGSFSVSQSVIVTNTGSSTLTINNIAVTGPNASSFVFANTCGSSLAAGANCSIHGHFAPTTAGALTASIQISDNAGASQQSISLSGAGYTAPAVSLSSTSLSFPSQAAGSSGVSQSVTLTNTGSSTLTISSIIVTGTNASSFVFANTCGPTLAAAANCTIHGHFAPAATGALAAAVIITDNASNSPQSVALSGTGAAPAGPVMLSATNLSFSATTVGASS